MKKAHEQSVFKKVAIATGGALAVLLLLDLTPAGGNVYTYSKWLSCGRWPLQSEIIILGEVPHYGETPRFTLLGGSKNLFCTPREAELAGYSAIPTDYDFPNLNVAERRAVLDKK